jgi:hypothetical protein
VLGHVRVDAGRDLVIDGSDRFDGDAVALHQRDGEFRQALVRLRDNGLLAPNADVEALAATTLAAIQGWLLLAKTSRDSSQLRTAFDGAIERLQSRDASDKRRARRR